MVRHDSAEPVSVPRHAAEGPRPGTEPEPSEPATAEATRIEFSGGRVVRGPGHDEAIPGRDVV